MDISNPRFISVSDRNDVMPYSQVVILLSWHHECSRIESHWKLTHFEQDFQILVFWKCAVLTTKNPRYLPQTHEKLHCHWGSNPQPFCYKAMRAATLPLVCCSVKFHRRNFFIYRGDWLSIKFGENDSFRKLILFFENTFQYLGGISQDISGSHFDSRRSLSSANRRQIVGDLPRRFFLSALLSLVINMTGRSERSARALRDGADVVREAIGN